MQDDTLNKIYEQLSSVNIMQLATSDNNLPWICSLHFYADKGINLYWISREDRRHSKEIKKNSKVSAVILIHENTSPEDYVIGLTVTGEAELIGEKPGRDIATEFAGKLNKPANLISDIENGANPHKFYRLKPSELVLFDTKNFPQDPRQVIVL